ncbi:MAG: hypothetical protein JWN88_3113 [Frankiales bacterium]|jgi:hypothetical protein|nr:hypothetical protein [Frankiales bacterium]
MALTWRPLGPEPAQTYWQRRGLLLGVVLLLLTAVVVLLTRGGDDADRLTGAAPSSDPAANASGAPETPAAPSGSPTSGTCAPPELQVVTASDAESYPAGGRPVLELRTTNTGPAPCTIDLGAAAVELLVVSGDDRIWSSDDCGSGGPAAPTTLEPGKTVTTKVTWAARRSLPGCAGPKAPAQPGTYRVSGRVGQLPASGGSFRITG